MNFREGEAVFLRLEGGHEVHMVVLGRTSRKDDISDFQTLTGIEARPTSRLHTVEKQVGDDKRLKSIQDGRPVEVRRSAICAASRLGNVLDGDFMEADEAIGREFSDQFDKVLQMNEGDEVELDNGDSVQTSFDIMSDFWADPDQYSPSSNVYDREAWASDVMVPKDSED